MAILKEIRPAGEEGHYVVWRHRGPESEEVLPEESEEGQEGFLELIEALQEERSRSASRSGSAEP